LLAERTRGLVEDVVGATIRISLSHRRHCLKTKFLVKRKAGLNTRKKKKICHINKRTIRTHDILTKKFRD